MTRLELIRMLNLSPLPGEGGYFRQTWVSSERVAGGTLGPRYAGDKALGTAIYYLVTDDPDGFSAMHRLPTDEVYHFYLGDPVEQLLLHPDGRSEVVVLGQDLRAGQRVQHVAPRDAWQGTRLVPGGRWALLGTTMAPGFDVSDYQAGDRAALLATWPTQADRIRALMRV
ncbi:cupin domain-containing protein [Luteitalea sp.]|jgi:hypothetical protein|uniref:cupin domain-containing protein n=1 Tax=Luteitalea sp. TaxID=2004800 RepID=UPI0037C7332E